MVMCVGFTAAKPSAGVCVNHQGVPSFALAGKPPTRGKGLTFCEEYRGETCCDAKTTDNVRRVAAHMQLGGFKTKCREVSDVERPRTGHPTDRDPDPNPNHVRRLTTSHSSSQAWTQLECSICDARAGITRKTKVCAHQCDAIYRACKDEYFTEDKLQRLTPCRSSDTICTKLGDWDDDMGGARMCEDAGYEVVSAGKSKADGTWCFDGSDVPKAGSGQRSSARTKDKKRRGGKKSGAAMDAEEIAKSGFYLLLAAALCVGYYAVRAYAGNRSGGSHSAARMAARMAAEARAQRASAYAKAGHML